MNTSLSCTLAPEKNGHTVHVFETDYIALSGRYPGEKGDRISKRLIGCSILESGRWADAIQKARELGAGERKKTFTFRPKPGHVLTLQSTVAEFKRRFPDESAPTINELVVGLFYFHVREEQMPRAHDDTSSADVVVTGALPESPVSEAKPVELPKEPKLLKIMPKSEALPIPQSRPRKAWILQIWSAVALILVIVLSLCILIQSSKAENQMILVRRQIDELVERHGQSERKAVLERLSYESERKEMAVASANQGVAIHDLKTEIHLLHTEIQKLKNQHDSLSMKVYGYR